jgi:hypothetical protein
MSDEPDDLWEIIRIDSENPHGVGTLDLSDDDLAQWRGIRN